MKKNVILLLFIAAPFFINAQNVGINNTGIAPDASAMLDISSNSKGLLLPRMKKEQRAAIANPKNGLLVYDSSTASFWFYKQNQWQELASNTSTSDSSLTYGQQAGSIASYNLDATTHNTIVSDSSGYIYDSGGPAGNYGNNEDYTIAVYSTIANLIGYRLEVINNSLENPFDTLFMQSGGTYPRSDTLTGTETGVYTFDNGPFLIHFKSNASTTAAGFKIRWDVILPPPAAAGGNPPMAGWYYTAPKLAMHGGYNYNNLWHQDNSGFSSFNYGYGNWASGDYSTTMGYYTRAFGKYATAFGYNTSAQGDHSTSLGNNTVAGGNASLAFGNQTGAYGEYSTAFGTSSSASGMLSTAWGSTAFATGYSTTAFGSFTAATNNNAVAWGSNTVASGQQSTAFGTGATASGLSSISIGAGTLASGDNSFALGSRVNTNSMQGSFAIGDATFYPISLGNDVQNQMLMRFAGGYKFHLNDVDVAMAIDGDGNTGIGTVTPLARLHVADNSVLFSATGAVPGQIGLPPTQGAGRRSMWYADKAAFRTGYVDGIQWNMNNTGNYSFASGYNTTASGYASTAMGDNTTASGTNSIAMGESTTAKSAYETVIGRWNTNYTPVSANGWNAPDRLFSVGNGTGPLSTSDALIIFKNGNATLAGNLTQNSDARLKKGIVPMQNSLQKITQLSGYNYYWKNENNDKDLQTGVLAQEVQKIFPQLVKEDNEGMLSVNYAGLIPVLIESIKEQQTQIDQLKKQVEQLLKK